VSGEGDGVWGDAVVPTAVATLEGAQNLVLPGVRHSMARIGSFDERGGDDHLWYGSPQVRRGGVRVPGRAARRGRRRGGMERGPSPSPPPPCEDPRAPKPTHARTPTPQVLDSWLYHVAAFDAAPGGGGGSSCSGGVVLPGAPAPRAEGADDA
jgi:hypothetical protein